MGRSAGGMSEPARERGKESPARRLCRAGLHALYQRIELALQTFERNLEALRQRWRT
jgi:hypothetical protein